MLKISLGEGRTLKMEAAGGKVYDLHFDTQGNPVGFRISLRGLTEPQVLIHKRTGARLPHSWGKNSPTHEHDALAFADKVRFFLRTAVMS